MSLLQPIRVSTILTAVATLTAISSPLKADPIPQTLSYQSLGTIGGTAGVGIGSFTLAPSQGTAEIPGAFTLGTFQAEPLPDGAGLTYTNLPFSIDIQFRDPSSTSSTPPVTDIVVQGVLNGTVTGTQASSVVASITSIEQNWATGTPLLSPTNLMIAVPQLLAPSGINGGVTPLIGQLSMPDPVPEAATVVLWGVGIALVARRSLRRKASFCA
jgi:hypothetical protein